MVYNAEESNDEADDVIVTYNIIIFVDQNNEKSKIEGRKWVENINLG